LPPPPAKPSPPFPPPGGLGPGSGGACAAGRTMRAARLAPQSPGLPRSAQRGRVHRRPGGGRAPVPAALRPGRSSGPGGAVPGARWPGRPSGPGPSTRAPTRARCLRAPAWGVPGLPGAGRPLMGRGLQGLRQSEA
ncbi:hypothetical protein P7K49_038284, partial [Saguinus oedipus]